MINLVADKEICQEAFKKGIKIESKFWWENITGEYQVSSLPSYQGWMNGIKTFDNCLEDLIKDGDSNVCPAPLTDEILQVLPFEVISQGISEFLTIYKEGENYRVGYGDFKFYDITDKKLSNALLYLATKLKDEKII